MVAADSQDDGGTASPLERGSSQQGSSRSRLGCVTCRKRKVKCDESRPQCRHCVRLSLTCVYQPHPPPSLRRKKHTSTKPVKGSEKSTGTASRVRAAEHSELLHEQGSEVQVQPHEQIANDGTLLDATRVPVEGIGTPNLDQTSTFGLGQELWDLDLLGEESIWAQLPIFSNSASDGAGADFSIFENTISAGVLEWPSADILAQTPSAQLTYSNQGGNSRNNGQPKFTSQGTIPPHVETTQFSPGSNISFTDIAPSEVVLLKHFVDFAIPPILVGVEPRWKVARNVLLRIARSSSLVRHAICSFSALSLSHKDTPSNDNQSSMHYYDLAVAELQDALERNEAADEQGSRQENEHILASIFFLSYVELMSSSRPKNTLEFLRRAHAISRANNSSVKTPLGNQLRIWLKLLDAKVVSAGGEGIHLVNNPALKDFDGPADGASEPTPGDNVETQLLEDEQATSNDAPDTEDILFHCINHSAYNFYVEVLDFAGRIAHLDKWHRSRGSVPDELEVMTAAEVIVKDLDALWARRPQILDLAAQGGGELGRHLSAKIAANVESHLRTYVANYYACFVHLQRAAYPYLESTPKTKGAVEQIVALVGLCDREEKLDRHIRLSVSMLWPLMMAGCEVEDGETREWLVGVVEGMSERVGNAARTALLVREICRRQKERGQRADARTVSQEIFGTIFAII